MFIDLPPDAQRPHNIVVEWLLSTIVGFGVVAAIIAFAGVCSLLGVIAVSVFGVIAGYWIIGGATLLATAALLYALMKRPR